MVSSILFAGGEDLNFIGLGGAIQTAAANGAFGIDTTAGRFRSGYARYALTYQQGQSGTVPSYIRNQPAFASSSFWMSTRLFVTSQGNASITPFIRFSDSGGVARLRLRMNNVAWPSTVVIEKVDAAGSATTLATSTLAFGTNTPATPDKIDIFINYAVSGTFTVYCNGVQIVTYSGDVTTNSQTSLSFVELGTPAITPSNGTNQGAPASYSETIVATRDTRNMSLVTQAPTANGNTHNWDSGTAANASANSMTTGQASPQYATSSGLIQEYQITPAVPTGNFSVISVVQTAQATVGTSGPTKFDFMVRTSATDYTSADQSPTTAWATFTNNWDTNPNTSAAWSTSDLAASSTSFNMGVKSIT